ncbi:MAG: hypothetical protein ACXW4T_00410 [Candidatus Limnocylindrales bacterium]
MAALVIATLVLGSAAPALALGSPTAAVMPPAGLTMEASVLLQGHARVGSWMAIDIHLKNDGPGLAGELRLAGGVQGRTRFGTPVDLPTLSDKSYRLYAQPPAFGREVEISLVNGPTTIATTKAGFTVHEAAQMVVGVVAEQPGRIIGDLDLLPNLNNVAPLTVGLGVADLPNRVEAWTSLDRLIWQDTDSSRLDADQLDALRGWIAGGGRLIVTGGTAGPASLSAFPDAILPYRPTTTTDVAPRSLGALLGEIPDDAKDLPALSGELIGGTALATTGDRVVAAERAYGSGAVTLIGFDPSADWIAGTRLAEGLWRRLIPTRAAGGLVIGDDSQIVSAASQLPSLALPPVGGLIALLGAYILLIGPINYLVLRRLDKREWAWVTMPLLIVTFAVGAYVFGSLLRGSDVIVNEVAIVRGAPGTTEGAAQAYLGVFSPTRGTYQVRVPGGALLSSPITGDFSVDGAGSTLDVLQGDPARIRDLGVGFGTLRTVRAETAVTVPLVTAELRLEDGRLKGTVTNGSNEVLLKPAVVLGGTVAKLDDLAPGATATLDTAMQQIQFGQQLSDRIVGQLFFEGRPGQGDETNRLYARHTIIDQLTFDPNFGFTGQLPADGAVILAWADRELIPVEIEGQVPRRTGNVLWFLPTDVSVRGKTTFRSDLLRNTVISSDAAFFNKDPFNISFGKGTAELSYRPISFKGTIAATQLAIGFNFGEPGFTVEPTLTQPLDSIPVVCGERPVAGCVQPPFDGLPELELYDLTTGTWRRFPHLGAGARFSMADPARYVDAATGTVLIRLVNDNNDQVGFSLDMSISGDVK